MKFSEGTKKSLTQFLGFLLKDISDAILTSLYSELEDEDDDCGFCCGCDDPEDLF